MSATEQQRPLLREWLGPSRWEECIFQINSTPSDSGPQFRLAAASVVAEQIIGRIREAEAYADSEPDPRLRSLWIDTATRLRELAVEPRSELSSPAAQHLSQFLEQLNREFGPERTIGTGRDGQRSVAEFVSQRLQVAQPVTPGSERTSAQPNVRDRLARLWREIGELRGRSAVILAAVFCAVGLGAAFGAVPAIYALGRGAYDWTRGTFFSKEPEPLVAQPSSSNSAINPGFDPSCPRATPVANANDQCGGRIRIRAPNASAASAPSTRTGADACVGMRGVLLIPRVRGTSSVGEVELLSLWNQDTYPALNAVVQSIPTAQRPSSSLDILCQYDSFLYDGDGNRWPQTESNFAGFWSARPLPQGVRRDSAYRYDIAIGAGLLPFLTPARADPPLPTGQLPSGAWTIDSPPRLPSRWRTILVALDMSASSEDMFVVRFMALRSATAGPIDASDQLVIGLPRIRRAIGSCSDVPVVVGVEAVRVSQEEARSMFSSATHVRSAAAPPAQFAGIVPNPLTAFERQAANPDVTFHAFLQQEQVVGLLRGFGGVSERRIAAGEVGLLPVSVQIAAANAPGPNAIQLASPPQADTRELPIGPEQQRLRVKLPAPYSPASCS